MQQIYIKARAKINLTLDVVGKRPDGYHDIRMIMQTVNLYDRIIMRKMKVPGIRLVTNLQWLPVDDKNLAYQAAVLMKNHFGISEGVFIDLRKKIPVAAGLAGGSSDAAAVLVGINKLFQIDASRQELMLLGEQLGADVPYCILRGTALAEGIGEKLTKLPTMPECFIVLAKPPISVSTPYVYKNLDLNAIQNRPDTENVIRALERGDLHTIAGGLCNVLETVTAKEYPIIEEIKEILIKYGAIGTIMSGSGPSVFGLFTHKETAIKASYQLKLQNKARDVFVTNTFNP